MQAPITLGSSVEEAFAGPQELAAAQRSLHKYGFAVWYRPEQSHILVVLRQGVSQREILRGAFSAHVFHHMLKDSHRLWSDPEQPSSAEHVQPATSPPSPPGTCRQAGNGAAQAQRQQHALLELMVEGNPASLLQLAYDDADELYPTFLQQAEQQGWQLDSTMLNTKDIRLCMG